MSARGLSLTTKIFLATAAVAAAVLGATLVVANMSARRTADQSVNKTLAATRDLVSTQLAARERMLRGSAEVFVQNSQFRFIIETKSAGDALDQAQGAKTQLEGQTVVGYGNPTDTSLFQAVSVPIIGAARVVGVLDP